MSIQHWQHWTRVFNIGNTGHEYIQHWQHWTRVFNIGNTGHEYSTLATLDTSIFNIGNTGQEYSTLATLDMSIFNIGNTGQEYSTLATLDTSIQHWQHWTRAYSTLATLDTSIQHWQHWTRVFNIGNTGQEYSTLATLDTILEDRKVGNGVLTEETFLGAHQDDPALVTYIRQHLLVAPSTLPYNLSRPQVTHFSQYGQSQYANNVILRNMTGGFFVEVGAVNGEYLSNTLFLERELGWSGLLIEPLETYHDLLYKHRKAYSINVALSLTNFTTQLTFHSTTGMRLLSAITLHLSYKDVGLSLTVMLILPYIRWKVIAKILYVCSQEGLQGGGSHIEDRREDENTIKNIKALPFYSILQAINITRIDFLSLDVESVELQVLRTIPWDKIRVRLMCIECNKVPEGRPALVKFLAERGYVFIGHRVIDCWFGWPDLLRETSL
nr:uncharacterized protein LOC123754708 [Procambarus clarkii]